MIIDLPRFIAAERPSWAELEAMLDKLENDPGFRMDVHHLQRFHLLYQRVSADLAKIATFASEPETRRYLESLTARAYGEIHETRERPVRFSPWRWFIYKFPRIFQRHILAFWLSLAVTMAGAAFGGVAVIADAEAKEAILPFSHLLGDPAKRVAEEERRGKDRMQGAKATFSSYLMTNNIKVSILTLASGMSWGVGTIVLLFYNGVILGAVAVDYIAAGKLVFLLGWLLPHGVIEIPAVLVAGQAGLVIGKALIGWSDRTPLKSRLRLVGNDVMTLIFGVALMLVWAGIVEAFLSQYHEPVIPYAAKIAFGLCELVLLVAFLGRKIAEERD